MRNPVESERDSGLKPNTIPAGDKTVISPCRLRPTIAPRPLSHQVVGFVLASAAYFDGHALDAARHNFGSLAVV